MFQKANQKANESKYPAVCEEYLLLLCILSLFLASTDNKRYRILYGSMNRGLVMLKNITITPSGTVLEYVPGRIYRIL